MRLVSFGEPGLERAGWLDGDLVHPLAGATNEILARLHGGADVRDLIDGARPPASLADVRLGPVVPRPSKVVLLGGTYQSALDEGERVMKAPPPTQSLLILKPPSALAGPYDAIMKPAETQCLDYEAELAVVMGDGGRRLSPADAAAAVAGYCAVQDISARDVSMGEAKIHPIYLQAARGKGFDTFCPLGPWLVTPDEAGDLTSLRIRCWVNDELRQDEVVGDLVSSVAELICDVSNFMRLEAGDVILTGTPAGCGSMMAPPRFLQPGDVLRTEISGLGHMVNVITDERAG